PSDTTGAYHCDCFAGYFIAEERMVWVPRSPFTTFHEFFRGVELARQSSEHEEREFGGGFGKHVGGGAEGDFQAIGGLSVCVFEGYGNLRGCFGVACCGLRGFLT